MIGCSSEVKQQNKHLAQIKRVFVHIYSIFAARLLVSVFFLLLFGQTGECVLECKNVKTTLQDHSEESQKWECRQQLA